KYMQGKSITCRVELLPLRDEPSAFIAFYLENQSPEPVVVHYFRPFVSFDVEASIKGRSIEIVTPALDIGVEPVSVALASGGTLRLDTPIRLVFNPRPGDSQEASPFEWCIAHEPTAVRLRFTLHIDPAVAGPCEATFEANS